MLEYLCNYEVFVNTFLTYFLGDFLSGLGRLLFVLFLFFVQDAAHAENKKPYVLVTGGAGYIGSQTCKALAAKGYIPVTFDSLQSGTEDAVKWGPLVIGDLMDPEALDRAFHAYPPVGVIHFAALTSVGTSVMDPSKFYWNNVVGSLTLLEAVRKHRIPVFIFSSTAAAYGIPLEGMVNEFSPLQPINPYGNTKLMVEKMLSDFERAYGIRYVCFRYFNAAGADMEGELGPNFQSATHLIPMIIQVAAKKRPYLEIYGTDFDTPDGTGVRDYIHVADLARAHVLGLEYLLDGNPSVVLNLGSGHGYSVKEVVAAVQKVTSRTIPLVYTARRTGDPAAVVADSSRAKEILGWEPCCSDLESMIRSCWQWHQAKYRE